MRIDHFDIWGKYRQDSQRNGLNNSIQASSNTLGSSVLSSYKQPYISITLTEQSALKIEYSAPFMDNPAPSEAQGRLWGLWEYEVLELFIAGANNEYLELEFGPHSHHLALYFKGERQLVEGHVKLEELSFWKDSLQSQSMIDHLQAKVKPAQWGGSCLIKQEHLPPSFLGNPESVDHSILTNQSQLNIAINAFWCFDDHHDSRQFYCAFPLPGSKPNFHQPAYFPRCTLHY